MNRIRKKCFSGLRNIRQTEYSAKLIDLYSMGKQHKEYKEELLFQVFSCRQDKLDYVNRLKSVCEQAEWETYREEILKGRIGWQIKYPLLEAEGMYERLLKEIVAEGSIVFLDQYEKVLKKKFPEQRKRNSKEGGSRMAGMLLSATGDDGRA